MIITASQGRSVFGGCETARAAHSAVVPQRDVGLQVHSEVVREARAAVFVNRGGAAKL